MLVEIKERMEFQTWLSTKYNVDSITEDIDSITLHTLPDERIVILKADIICMEPLVIMAEE